MGVFPAAPLVCCMMLLEFFPRSQPPVGLSGNPFLSALWVFVLKLHQVYLSFYGAWESQARAALVCHSPAFLLETRPPCCAGSALHPRYFPGRAYTSWPHQASDTAENTKSFTSWLKDFYMCMCVYKYIYIYMIEIYFYSGILLGKSKQEEENAIDLPWGCPKTLVSLVRGKAPVCFEMNMPSC